LLCVKDNQPTLKEAIALYIAEEKLEKAVSLEKNGGRFEKRSRYALGLWPRRTQQSRVSVIEIND